MSQKTSIQLKKVFLQFPADGDPGPNGLRVNASDAHRWVGPALGVLGLDSVLITQAQDFYTKEAADKCNSHYGNVFLVREVTVTYEF